MSQSGNRPPQQSGTPPQSHNSPRGNQNGGGDKYARQTEKYIEKYPWLDSMINPNEKIIALQHPHIIIYMIQILTGFALVVGGFYVTFVGIPQIQQYVNIDLSWYPLLISLLGVGLILFELYKRSRTFYVLTDDKFLERHRILAQRKNPIKWNRAANVNTYQSKSDVLMSKLLPKTRLGHIRVSTAEDARPQLVYPGVKNMRKIESIIEFYTSEAAQNDHTTGVYGQQNGGGRGGGQYPDDSGGGEPQQRQPPQNQPPQNQQQQPPQGQQPQGQQQNFNRPQQSNQDFNPRNGGSNGGNGNGNGGGGGEQYPDRSPQQNQQRQQQEQQDQHEYSGVDTGEFDDDEIESGDSRSMFDDVDDGGVTDPPDRYTDDDDEDYDDNPAEPW